MASSGIKTLLDAEKEATVIVQQAREYRDKQIKGAEEEAKQDIDSYRNQCESEFKKFEEKHSGTTEALQSSIDTETSTKLDDITKSFDKNKKSVVDFLLDSALTVDPKPHRNLSVK